MQHLFIICNFNCTANYSKQFCIESFHKLKIMSNDWNLDVEVLKVTMFCKKNSLKLAVCMPFSNCDHIYTQSHFQNQWPQNLCTQLNTIIISNMLFFHANLAAKHQTCDTIQHVWLVMWYTKFKFRGRFSNPVHNTVLWLDTTFLVESNSRHD